MSDFYKKSRRAEKAAQRYLEKHDQEQSLMLATWILHYLAEQHYVAWQTYTKEDVQCITGAEEVSDEYMERLQENIEECFHCIEPEGL